MKAMDIIAAFTLPPECRVDQRVPKKLLVENGAYTTADKRQINEGIEELIWVAALKPNTVGVPEYRDTVREYLEIAVLTVTFRASVKQNRMVELIHRAIPYPVVLVANINNAASLSLAHKRWSQGETGKVVIEDIRQTHQFQLDSPTKIESVFLAGIALSQLSRQNLLVLYQGWMDRIAALEAAQITGTFMTPGSIDRGTVLQDDLNKYTRLQREIAVLRTQAAKEKQINRRVELNLEIKRLESEQARITKSLQQE